MNNITVRELLNILIKNIIIIIISAVICASGAYIYCEKFTDEKQIEESRKPCIDWWKDNYTVENGAFWYLTSKFSKEV